MVAGERDQGLGFQAEVCKGLEMHGFCERREITRRVGRRGRQGVGGWGLIVRVRVRRDRPVLGPILCNLCKQRLTGCH